MGGNTMNVSLTPELEKIVNKRVKSGMYNSASEVVREALTTKTKREGNAKKAKPSRRRNPAVSQLSEETRKLTLKAFRLAYEAHNKKSL